jgi:hypothetical protein
MQLRGYLGLVAALMFIFSHQPARSQSQPSPLALVGYVISILDIRGKVELIRSGRPIDIVIGTPVYRGDIIRIEGNVVVVIETNTGDIRIDPANPVREVTRAPPPQAPPEATGLLQSIVDAMRATAGSVKGTSRTPSVYSDCSVRGSLHLPLLPAGRQFVESRRLSINVAWRTGDPPYTTPPGASQVRIADSGRPCRGSFGTVDLPLSSAGSPPLRVALRDGQARSVEWTIERVPGGEIGVPPWSGQEASPDLAALAVMMAIKTRPLQYRLELFSRLTELVSVSPLAWTAVNWTLTEQAW